MISVKWENWLNCDRWDMGNEGEGFKDDLYIFGLSGGVEESLMGMIYLVCVMISLRNLLFI